MQRLKEFRAKNKYSVKQISQMLGVHEDVYYKIERGAREPTYRFIKRFKDTFGVVVDEIFF